MYGSVVVVVLGGTSYELSTNFKVNSGTDGLGIEVGSPLGDGVGVVAGVGVAVGERLFGVWLIKYVIAYAYCGNYG